LSATPFRSDGVKLCFDVVIRDAGIRQLIQDGYLSPFEHYTIPEYTPERVVECYAREPNRWGKSILYFHKLSQCREARRRLAKRGISAEVVCGSSDREAQIESFREGRLQVLVNCLMLGEGFDCPDLETVFCRPSGRSVTVQACGRVLRKSPHAPLKRIVQCQETRWPFIRTATPTNQFHATEGAWRTLEANPQVQQLGQRMMQILARTNTEMPAFLGKQTRRRAGDRDLT
jgi:superfamily II DNA or RNA helicase